jgi:nucleotide-binding universal stress UspA family protein
MYKTILVPLDSSGRAEQILPHVEQLAQRFGARIILLQVVEPVVGTLADYREGTRFPPTEVDHQIQAARSYLTVLQSKLQERGFDTEIQVEYGPVVPTIQAAADQHQVDLIALASHGRTGLARVFYGSVAAGVLNRVDRPLLLIRAQEESA